MKKLVIVIMLFLTTGCMTRQSVLSMIEEHHASEVVPVMTEQTTSIEGHNQKLESYVAQMDETQQMLMSHDTKISENKKQIAIVKVRIDENTYKVIETNDQLTLHKELLFETFGQQKVMAETAMARLKEKLEPEMPADGELIPDQTMMNGE